MSSRRAGRRCQPVEVMLTNVERTTAALMVDTFAGTSRSCIIGAAIRALSSMSHDEIANWIEYAYIGRTQP